MKVVERVAKGGARSIEILVAIGNIFLSLSLCLRLPEKGDRRRLGRGRCCYSTQDERGMLFVAEGKFGGTCAAFFFHCYLFLTGMGVCPVDE